MNKEEVIDAINTAFASVVLGAGIGLWEAQAIDDHRGKEARQRARDQDEKERWQRLSHEVLHRCDSSLCFFDADGMRFHLPAYILASLEGQVDAPLFHLTQLDEYALSKLVSLNSEQRDAIALYLQWCLEQPEYEFDHPVIRRVLDDYWRRTPTARIPTPPRFNSCR